MQGISLPLAPHCRPPFARPLPRSVSLDPRRSVPAEEVHRIVRDMRRAERRVLTAASDTDSGVRA